MKSFNLGTSYAPRYLPGNFLLETERFAALSLRPLTEPAAQLGKDDDLPVLRDVLTFLKFTPEETKRFTEVASSLTNIVGGIVSVIGTVNSVVELMNTLEVFGPQQDATQVALENIGKRLDQIYNYLIEEEIKGLHLDAVKWRSSWTGARNALMNAQLSPTSSIIDELVARTAELDNALKLMLDPVNANIPFMRKVYNYAAYNVSTHWIDAALQPFMTRADGKAIYDYASSDQELQARIFDPGHYIDVLFSALSERILVTVTIEPAFRSTAYDRKNLKLIVEGLTKLISEWRGAMLVANPAAGLGLGGGEPGRLINPYKLDAMYHPYTQSAPEGIVLGAVDQVMGIAAWEPFWEGFARVKVVTTSPLEAYGGGYDEVWAKDPPKALADATQRQAQMLDQVVGACGIGALVQLRAQLQLAASEVIGSEFVRLPNARFSLVREGVTIQGHPVFALRKGGVESVDLGDRHNSYAQDPKKKYTGTRYFQESKKTFKFRMARRTSRTLMQLGYRLRIGPIDIPLVPFSIGGFDRNVTPFPTETIAMEVHDAAPVYDVRQSHVFSFAEEDLFEAGKPIAAPRWDRWGIPGWRGRLFLNERMGQVAFAVEVRFEYDATGQDYTGEAIVTIRNLDPERFPNGVILPVEVFETHMNGDASPKPQEYLADRMTVHLVPSFLVMGPEYFAAHWEAVGLMAKSIKELDVRFGLQPGQVPRRRPIPDPQWAVRRQVLETVAMVDAIDAIRSTHPEAVTEVIQQFRPPAVATP